MLHGGGDSSGRAVFSLSFPRIAAPPGMHRLLVAHWLMGVCGCDLSASRDAEADVLVAWRVALFGGCCLQTT